MARRAARKASFSWVVRLAAALVVLSALTLLAAPAGYRLGVLPLRTALLTVLRWGAYGAAAAAAVSVLGLGFQLAQPRNARRGVWLALLSLVLAGALVFDSGRLPARPAHSLPSTTSAPIPKTRRRSSPSSR